MRPRPWPPPPGGPVPSPLGMMNLLSSVDLSPRHTSCRYRATGLPTPTTHAESASSASAETSAETESSEKSPRKGKSHGAPIRHAHSIRWRIGRTLRKIRGSNADPHPNRRVHESGSGIACAISCGASCHRSHSGGTGSIASWHLTHLLFDPIRIV